MALVVHRKQHLGEYRSSYSHDGFFASSNDISRTVKDWNSLGETSYIDASDTNSIKAEIEKALQEHGLNKSQIQAAGSSASELIGALKDHEYSEFMQVRLPSDTYAINDGVAQGLRRYAGLDSSSSLLDCYKKVWESTFETNSLWSQIFLCPTNAVMLRTNFAVVKNRVNLPRFPGSKGNVYVVSYTTIAFDYSALQQEELRLNNDVLTLSMFFMGRDPGSNEARPFMLSFFWSSSLKKWIPFDFVHGFIHNPSAKFRFF